MRVFGIGPRCAPSSISKTSSGGIVCSAILARHSPSQRVLDGCGPTGMAMVIGAANICNLCLPDAYVVYCARQATQPMGGFSFAWPRSVQWVLPDNSTAADRGLHIFGSMPMESDHIARRLRLYLVLILMMVGCFAIGLFVWQPAIYIAAGLALILASIAATELWKR